jgi:hypothetical protein
MKPFKSWLRERDKQLYDEFSLSDKLKANLDDLKSYGKGIGYGALAGTAGTLAAGPLVGLPLGWATAFATANRDYNDKHKVRKIKK